MIYCHGPFLVGNFSKVSEINIVVRLFSNLYYKLSTVDIFEAVKTIRNVDVRKFQGDTKCKVPSKLFFLLMLRHLFTRDSQ